MDMEISSSRRSRGKDSEVLRLPANTLGLELISRISFTVYLRCLSFFYSGRWSMSLVFFRSFSSTWLRGDSGEVRRYFCAQVSG